MRAGIAQSIEGPVHTKEGDNWYGWAKAAYELLALPSRFLIEKSRWLTETQYTRRAARLAAPRDKSRVQGGNDSDRRWRHDV